MSAIALLNKMPCSGVDVCCVLVDRVVWFSKTIYTVLSGSSTLKDALENGRHVCEKRIKQIMSLIMYSQKNLRKKSKKKKEEGRSTYIYLYILVLYMSKSQTSKQSHESHWSHKHK